MAAPSSCKRLSDLPTPAFVVNRRAFQENCNRVLTVAYANGIHRLRPHVKTHKTKEGCLIQAGLGGAVESGLPTSEVIGFVVSTIPELSMVIGMACQQRGRPFSDVLLGIPICKSKLSAIHKLKSKLASATNGDGRIHILADNPHQVDFLEDFLSSTSSLAGTKWSVFLKVDTGYHRAGTTCDVQGASLAKRIIDSPHLILKGLYSHCGHSYSIDDDVEMKNLASEDQTELFEFMELLADYLAKNGSSFDISTLDISVGSTPSMFAHSGPASMPNNFELHPGNYVLYDRQQLFTGACASEGSIAGFVLARVIGHYRDDRNAIMVDAGATALTKETTPQGDVCAVFGRPELECYRMSQEVTMIRCRARQNGAFPFDEFPLGSTMLLIPNHSCLAAACFVSYHVVDEADSPFGTDAKIVDEWTPVKGWA
ncbi:hypothetical protein ACHAWF_018868 [Thalassiosira exigua]